MKLAIMQPYFLPYLGYYQIIQAVDLFVVYDNIQFSKKGWIHRNRYLVNGEDRMFSLPLKKASDYLDVDCRELADDFGATAQKLVRQIKAAYGSAPQFADVAPLIDQCFEPGLSNLFQFVYRSLELTTDFLGLGTQLVVSSSIEIDHGLKGEDRVLAMTEAVNAECYINTIAGEHLYSPERFHDIGAELRFLQPKYFDYEQLGGTFVPWLSVIDVLMFNSLDRVRGWLSEGYDLVNPGRR